MVKTSLIIYAGHFLSSWGDRMWYFAIPLFLLDIDPTSLTLSAAYGLTLAVTVLVFGPLVGDWIDKKTRLYSVKIALVTQNSAVTLCAAILLLNREFGDPHAGYVVAVEMSAILLGSISQLASVATGIIIQKDWLVVVSEGKSDMLSNLNAMMRRIDLATKILAPLVCGQIMAVASLTAGAIFICGWNVVSMVVEYVLLKTVYNRTPELHFKNLKRNEEEPTGVELEGLEEEDTETNEEMNSVDTDNDDASLTPAEKKISIWSKMFGFLLVIKKGWRLYIAQPISLPCFGFSFLYMTVLGFGYITTSYAYNQCFSEFMVGVMLALAAVTGIIATFAFPVLRSKVGLIRAGMFSAVFQMFTLIFCILSIFLPGSPFYALQANQKPTENVFNTTALPLNSTSTSYLSTFSTILSTVDYSPTSDYLTTTTVLPSTAYINATTAYSTPYYNDSTSNPISTPIINNTSINNNNNTVVTTTDNISGSSSSFPVTTTSLASATGTSITTTLPTITSVFASTSNAPDVSKGSELIIKCLENTVQPVSFVSLSVLMTGIILARIGLWGFDLAITQLIQENIQEQERGIFNGVQTSLNNLMDMLQYILVLVFPRPDQFAILIILSSIFICFGYMLYFIYANKVRGHILPHCNGSKCEAMVATQQRPVIDQEIPI